LGFGVPELSRALSCWAGRARAKTAFLPELAIPNPVSVFPGKSILSTYELFNLETVRLFQARLVRKLDLWSRNKPREKEKYYRHLIFKVSIFIFCFYTTK